MLEDRLVELKFVTTPKLDVLCSATFPPHSKESRKMAKLPPSCGKGSKITDRSVYRRGWTFSPTA